MSPHDRALEADRDGAYDRRHQNCGEGYVCDEVAGGCGRPVCGRCEPSPGEVINLCPECDWNRGDAA